MFTTTAASSAPVVSGLMEPDKAPRKPGIDAELGAPAGSPNAARNVVWNARLSGETVQVSSDGSAWTDVITVAGIASNISVSFDGLMRTMVSYQTGAGTDTSIRAAHLYWYDQTAPGFVTLDVADVSSPMLTFDYSPDADAPGAEVIWFYVRAGSVCYRRQADRFTVEHTFAALPAGTSRITGCGLGTNWRLHVRVE